MSDLGLGEVCVSFLKEVGSGPGCKSSEVLLLVASI